MEKTAPEIAKDSIKGEVLPDGWRRARLGELLRLRKQVVHPRDNPTGPSVFVGLEHIEPDTGRRVGSQPVEMSQLTGRKPRFCAGDIVYGYLRPYLNKVWVAEFEGLCSVDQYVYEVDSREADTEFIAAFMRSAAYLSRAPISTTPGQLPRIRTEEVASVALALPPIPEQRRIAAHLSEQLAAVAQARVAVQAQTETLGTLSHAVLRESLSNGNSQPVRFADCLCEVTEGIGDDWRKYPLLGATRAGLAPAKEGVGKNPGRYKPVRPGTIFYNPMRILLGSIAMLDEDDAPGITSPDYVVMAAVEGRLSARWFYHWFRSRYGAEFIKSMTRERVCFESFAHSSLGLCM